ncbi:MAG: hypothetical protein V3U80_06740 [Flavobacteriaceae bacterium]
MIFRFLILFIFFVSCKSKDTNGVSNKNVVAKISKNEKVEILIDTVNLKLKIKENVFSKDSNINFYKVKIVKKEFINSNDFNYMIILFDSIKKVKTARYLMKHGRYLIFSDKTSFEQTFVTCVSKKKKCYPNIFIKNNNILEKNWICSDKIQECSINENENCTIYRSILLN